MIDGTAGDFDLGVRSSAAGVNVAAGDDPLTATSTTEASDVRLWVGDTVTVKTTIAATPSMSTLGATAFSWNDGTYDAPSYNYNPEVSVGTDVRSHSYATAGGYGAGGG